MSFRACVNQGNRQSPAGESFCDPKPTFVTVMITEGLQQNSVRGQAYIGNRSQRQSLFDGIGFDMGYS